MIALWLISGLLVKHFLCDFPFQTKQMLEDKGSYLQLGGVHHAFAHGLGTMVVFMMFGFYEVAGTLAVLDTLFHYHIDYAKSKINQWADLKHDNQRFWDSHGADQLAHGLTYVLLVFLALSVSIKA